MTESWEGILSFTKSLTGTKSSHNEKFNSEVKNLSIDEEVINENNPEGVLGQRFQYPDGVYGFGKSGELLYEITLQNNCIVKLRPNGFDSNDVNPIYRSTVTFVMTSYRGDLRKTNNTGYLLVQFK